MLMVHIVVLPADFLCLVCPINTLRYWIGIKFIINNERQECDTFFVPAKFILCLKLLAPEGAAVSRLTVVEGLIGVYVDLAH